MKILIIAVLFVIVLVSCGEFDNPLDPTVNTPPTSYFKFYRDSLTTYSELEIFEDNYYIGLDSLLVELGVSDDRDSDVDISMELYQSSNDSLIGSYLFRTGVDSLHTILNLDFDALTDSANYALIRATDSNQHSKVDSVAFTYDYISPTLNDNYDDFIRSTSGVLDLVFSEKILDFEMIFNEEVVASENNFDNDSLSVDYEITSRDIDFGGYDFICRFRDRALNLNEEIITLTYCDTFTIENVTPESGTLTNNQPLTIHITGNHDLGALNESDISISPSGANLENIAVTNETASFDLMTDEQINVEYSIDINLTDIWGQTQNKSLSYTIDSEPPQLDTGDLTIHTFDEEITLSFSEPISSCTVTNTNSEVWFSNNNVNNTSISFNCQFDDGETGTKLHIGFTDIVGNNGDGDINVSPDDFYLVNAPSPEEYFDVTSYSENLEFSNPLDPDGYEVSLGGSTVSATPTNNNYNLLIENSFTTQGNYTFNGEFTDIWAQNINDVEWNVYFDILTEIDSTTFSFVPQDSILTVNVVLTEDILDNPSITSPQPGIVQNITVVGNIVTYDFVLDSIPNEEIVIDFEMIVTDANVPTGFQANAETTIAFEITVPYPTLK